jgi:hypothetical protein
MLTGDAVGETWRERVMRRSLCVLVLVGIVLVSSPVEGVEKTDVDRAVARGVAALRQLQKGDGTWGTEVGPTALAALTMLECEVKSDDPAIKKAAAAVRKASPTLNATYGLALAILFLDRLGEAADTPLIESMVVRLMAGQAPTGGWTYSCPDLGPAEVKRLTESIDGQRTLVSGRDLKKLPPRGKRSVKDLAPEIQVQLQVLARAAAAAGITGGDNSNTQFATLAMWVGRRYGLPVHNSLRLIDARFRKHQNADGGWTYGEPILGGMMLGPGAGGMNASTPTMTCAGLLGLACGHGALLDKARKKGEDAKRDVSKDANINAGLRALSTAIGHPLNGKGRPPVARGKAYYFFWSLERVGMIFNLDTIGGKDWYNWGAEIILANQLTDGSWSGEYSADGADTCFALLFLIRSNLVRDLSSGLRHGGRGLRAGNFGGASLLKGVKPLGGAGIGDSDKKPEAKPAPKRPGRESSSGKLANSLLDATGANRADLLDKLRAGKGVMYTEALAAAIPHLDGAHRNKAREALATRLARMKVDTLRNYLRDEDPEIRRAAALACAAKDGKVLVPDLIRLLNDPDPVVERAAYAALKPLTGQDFGPKADATGTEKARAIVAWERWWRNKARE